MKIGVDVDGVLANFSKGYAELIVELTGKNLFLPGDIEDPPVWDWDILRGYTKEEVKATWDNIVSGTTFWAMLEPLPGTKEFLEWLWQSDHEVYFITNRSGRLVQFQTAVFLSQNGFKLPSVVIAKDKGDSCDGLGIDVYLDDKGENILDVLEKSGATAILKTYRHNEWLRDTIAREGGLTCSTLENFKQWVIGYDQRLEASV